MDCRNYINDRTLWSDNSFRKNLIEWIYNKITGIEDLIQDEKIRYHINREAAKISVLSSGKINKYKYLPGEEILPSN